MEFKWRLQRQKQSAKWRYKMSMGVAGRVPRFNEPKGIGYSYYTMRDSKFVGKEGAPDPAGAAAEPLKVLPCGHAQRTRRPSSSHYSRTTGNKISSSELPDVKASGQHRVEQCATCHPP